MGMKIISQNLQARIRETMLMSISNERGKLFLSMGSKLELLPGYCTLYRIITCGFAVLSNAP
jgi:NAD+ synthase (glutamine-hydrolysing)